MLKLKVPYILTILSVISSIVIIILYYVGFNIFSKPEPTPKELLEKTLQEDNNSNINEESGGSLVDVLLPPSLSYFQFVLSFSSNLKNDNNIMNIELALATFEGEGYHARLKHHEPALRKVVLDTMSETPEELIRTKKGKEEFALNLLNAINLKLEELEEDPAIESVNFSAFAIR